jgi:hypothetical protein
MFAREFVGNRCKFKLKIWRGKGWLEKQNDRFPKPNPAKSLATPSVLAIP